MGVKKDDNKPLLFVHQGFELYGSDRMFLLTVMAASRKYSGRQIVVVIPRPGLLSEQLGRLPNVRIRFRETGAVRKYEFKRLDFRALFRILTFFRLARSLNSFEFVFINTSIILDYILAARYCDSRVFVHIHEIPDSFARYIIRMALNFSAPSLIFVSDSVKSEFGSLRSTNQVVVPNGCFSIMNFLQNPDPDGKIRILMPGRINKWKGQGLLIEAVAMLPPETREKLQVRILGSVYGKQEHLLTNLKNRIAFHRLEKIVELVPFTDDISTHYNWCKIVVVPSVKPEPFGIVSIEAMSLGRTVIAANNGGLRKIIEHNRTGLLFEAGNARDLAEKISELLLNPGMMTEIGVNARKVYLEKYSEDKYMNRICEII